MPRFIGLLMGPLLLPAAVAAQTPTCDALPAAHKAVAQELLVQQHPYDCCDDTIAKCLQAKPTCRLAVRLADNICRRVAKEQDKKDIARFLSHRARTMFAMGKPAKIDLTGLPPVGDPKAPVKLVEYACGRCPFCAKITPELHQAVTSGPLKGKAVLYFKTFPIRSHEGSKAAGLAMMAALQLDVFWEYLLHSYAHFDDFCPKRPMAWAKELGLDVTAFEQFMADPALEKRLIASKKEGLANKVDATPTFFINGRRYYAELTRDEIVDVVEEEIERLAGQGYLP